MSLQSVLQVLWKEVGVSGDEILRELPSCFTAFIKNICQIAPLLLHQNAIVH